VPEVGSPASDIGESGPGFAGFRSNKNPIFLFLESGTMTKRDRQASEYVAESYGKTPTERGVSHTAGALTDEEREAIYRAEARLRTAYVPDDQTAATLRKLLGRTNHDAVPEAKAHTDATGEPGGVDGVGTGDICERLRQFDRSQPIKPADATLATHATPGEGTVQAECTLTDEERAAVEWAARQAKVLLYGNKTAATLRSLLERMK
jgi:hypothetical protein